MTVNAPPAKQLHGSSVIRKPQMAAAHSFLWQQNFCCCMLGMSTWLINMKQAGVWIAKAMAAPCWLSLSMLSSHAELFGGETFTGHEVTCFWLPDCPKDRLPWDKLWCESEACRLLHNYCLRDKCEVAHAVWTEGEVCLRLCPELSVWPGSYGGAVRPWWGSPCSNLFCSSCPEHVHGASAHAIDGLLSSVPA